MQLQEGKEPCKHKLPTGFLILYFTLTPVQDAVLAPSACSFAW
jgi:hypothetical protein